MFQKKRNQPMSLNRLIEEHVSTVFLNTNHFAETVDVVSDYGNQMAVTAIVDLPEVSGRDVEGTMVMSEVAFSRLNYRSGTPFIARRKNVEFDIYRVLPSDMGMVTMLIRRKFAEETHTDLYDLHGNQIPYAD